MGLTLSTEHEQTLSDSTVYQWNIPLPFPSPSLSPTLSSSPPLSLHPYQRPSIRLSFNFSFQVQSFWRPLTPPPPDTSPSFSVFLCWAVNLSSPPSASLSLMKSICFSTWWQPVSHHTTVSNMCIHVDLRVLECGLFPSESETQELFERKLLSSRCSEFKKIRSLILVWFLQVAHLEK